MKNIILIILLFITTNALADGHSGPGEGSFSTLEVAAKDIDKYVDYLRSNSTAFEAIGSNGSGVCITRSGHDYPGQMMIFNAFNNISDAMSGTLKYDPFEAPNAISKLREVKYSTIWKPLKKFRLDPGFELVRRVIVKQENMSAFAEAMSVLEKEIQDNGHETFFNGVFVSLGGGSYESNTLMVRSITSDAREQGQIADEFFEGKYNESYSAAMALTDGIVSDNVQVCEQLYFID